MSTKERLKIFQKSNHNKLFAFFLCAFIVLAIVVQAAPPTDPYAPGETLDPSCAPGSAFCTVQQIVVATTTGNYGIGTTSPYAKLSVVGEIVATEFIADDASATSTFMGSVTVGGNLNFNGTLLQNGTPVGVSLWSNNGSSMYYNSGKIGIGTSSPYAALSVVGEVVASFFTATSTLATSTFSGPIMALGGLVVGTTTNGLSIDTGDILASALLFSGSTTVSFDGGNLVFSDDNLGQKTLSQLAAGPVSTGCTQNNTVLSGGVVTYSGSGLVYDVSPVTYCINGLQYSITGNTQVSLPAADPSLDRIDAIIINTSSNSTYLQGVPSANPVSPSANPSTQLELTFVYVKTGAVMPGENGTGPTREYFYLDNAEWVGSQVTPVGQVGFSDVTDPQQGSNNVEVTTPLRAGEYFQFATSSAGWDPTGFQVISFYIKNKSSWGSKDKMNISFLNSSQATLGAPVTLTQNTYSFKKTDTTNYQKISIPLSDFGTIGSTAIKYLRFTSLPQGNGTLNFRVDNIVAEGTSQSTTSSSFSNDGTVLSGTLNKLAYYSGTTTVSSFNTLTVDTTNGRLGVGTSTPEALLDINGQTIIGSVGSPAYLTMYGTADRSVNFQKLFIQYGGGDFKIGSQSSGAAQVVPIAISADTLKFTDGSNQEAARFINSNLGLGTTSPYAKLSVVGEVVARNFNATSTNSTSTFAGFVSAGRLDLTGNATNTSAQGFNITNGCYSVNGACISGGGASQWTTSGSNIFYDTGNVGIGTSSPYAALSVVGQVVASNFHATSSTATSTFAGNLSVNGTGINFGTNTRFYQNGQQFMFSSTTSAGNLTIGYRSAPGLDGGGGLYSTYIGYQSGLTATSSISNTAVGYRALSNVLDAGSFFPGSYNSAFGKEALLNNTTGYKNSAFGYEAMQSNRTGLGNTVFGFQALQNSTTADSNTAIGHAALRLSTTGPGNVVVGYSAMENNVSATNTVALGYLAANGFNANYSNQNGVYVGYGSGYNVTTGSNNNTFVGYQSGFSNTSGAFNIALGSNTNLSSTTGNQQLNIGNVLFASGLYNGATPSGVAFAGSKFGVSTSTPGAKLSVAGDSNGTFPLLLISTSTASATSTAFIIDSNGKVGVGTTSPYAQLSINGVTASGSFSADNNFATSTFTGGLDVTGGFLNFGSNTKIYQNGQPFITSSTTVAGNLSIGYQAASQLDSSGGLANTYIGYQAGQSATSSQNNTAVGYQALKNVVNTSIGGGWFNTSVGYQALLGNTTGTRNIGIGTNVLNTNTTGSQNTSIGFQSLYFNNAAAGSVALGYAAAQGSGNYTNQNGTYLGYQSGFLAGTGSNNNTFIGYNSGYSNTTGNTNLVIGYNTDVPIVTGSQQMNIANLLYGTGIFNGSLVSSIPNIGSKLGISTSTPGAKLSVAGDSNGTFPLLLISTSTASATSTAFIIDSNGKVGVGTSSPSHTLTVRGDSAFSGNVGINSFSPTSLLQVDFTNNFNSPLNIRQNVSGVYYPALTMSNVGVLTYGPNLGAASVAIDFGNNTTEANSLGADFFRINPANNIGNVFHVKEGNISRLVVDGNGNVGIGTSSPYVALSVVGSTGVVADIFSATNTLATSTFAGFVSAGRLNLTGNATNTSAQGFNITNGCYSVNGACISGGGSNPWTVTGSNISYTTDTNTSIGYQAASGLLSGGGLSNTFLGFQAGQIATSSNFNTGIGHQALANITDGPFGLGDNNTALGYQALFSNTTGFSNSAQGFGSMFANTVGSYNTAQGDSSLFSNTTGTNNTAQGYLSLYTNDNGTYNTAQGVKSLHSNVSGSYNTAVGGESLYGNIDGTGNSALGFDSLLSNTSGSYNAVLGMQALFSNTTGTDNTAAGFEALLNNITGSYNTSIGSNSLFYNHSATNTVALGYNAARGTDYYSNENGVYIGVEAGSALETGSNDNTFVGYQSGRSNTTAPYNSAFGSKSLFSNLTGSLNTAIGMDSLYSNTIGNSNTAIGMQSLNSNISGSYNTAQGESSLFANQTGVENTSQGYRSLYSNVSGSYNSALGTSALYNNLAGMNNAAFGVSSLYFSNANNNSAVGVESSFKNTSGSDNAALGYDSLFNNTTGSNNVSVGANSLYNNVSATNTVAIGYSAGNGTTPYSNQNSVYVGYQAGYSATNGSDSNTFLGYQAGYSATTGNTNIAIGYNIDLPSATANQQLNIGNLIYGSGLYNGGTVSAVPTGGNVGIGTSSPWVNLSVEGRVALSGLTSGIGAGSLCLTSAGEVVYNSANDACLSSIRSTKHDINPLEVSATSMINHLQPVSFVYNEGDGRTRFGFIAEDAAGVDDHLATHDASGNLSGIDDRAMISLTVKSLQELYKTLDISTKDGTVRSLRLDGIESRIVRLENSTSTTASMLGDWVKTLAETTIDKIVAITGTFTNLIADTLTSKIVYSDELNTKKLCVGSVCVTEDEFRMLLQRSGVAAVLPSVVTSSTTQSTTTSTLIIVLPSPSVTPTISPTPTLLPTITPSVTPTPTPTTANNNSSGGSSNTPTPTTTPEPSPSNTPPVATISPQVTNSPSPSASPSSLITSTPSPTSSITPLPSLTPSPTPEPVITLLPISTPAPTQVPTPEPTTAIDPTTFQPVVVEPTVTTPEPPTIIN